MTREEFIFTIGFDGDEAVVDKKSMHQYGKKRTEELFDAGLVKAAVCSAVFSGSSDEEKLVLEKYNSIVAHPIASFGELRNFFGVRNPADIKESGKTILL